MRYNNRLLKLGHNPSVLEWRYKINYSKIYDKTCRLLVGQDREKPVISSLNLVTAAGIEKRNELQ